MRDYADYKPKQPSWTWREVAGQVFVWCLVALACAGIWELSIRQF